MASFGAQLKREREQRKVTLDDISVSTKIGTRFLRAIEENHFDQLPGGIFNKGFIRAYARHLGLDEEQTLADFLEATGVDPAEKKSELPAAPVLDPPEREESTGAGIPWGTVAIILLIAALSLAIWSFYSREKQKEAGGHANAGSVEAIPTSAASLQPASTDRPAVAVPVAQSSSSEQSQAVAGTFVVMLKAHDDSWISGTVDGTQIPGETLVATTQKSFEAHRQVVVRAGNVGAVDVYFNGQKLPPQGEEGEVKTMTFDSRGLQVPPKP